MRTAKVLYSPRVFLLFILLMGLTLLAGVSKASPQAYEKATQSYFSQNYKQAAQQFEALIAEYPQNGYLHYNLGNSYFKMGQLGKAVYQYEKAYQLIPRQADLQTNLKLAQKKLTDEVGESLSDYLMGTFYTFWSGYLTLPEYQILFLLVSFFFWGQAFWILIRRQKWTRLRFALSFFFFIYIGLGYHLKSDLQAPGQYGIVLVPQADVKAIYMDKDKALFQIHEGTKVRVIDSQEFAPDQSWVRIQLPAGQKGWVRSQAIGIL